MTNHRGIARALADLAPPAADLEAWLWSIRQRFGFPEEIFDGYAFVVQGKKFLFAASRDHDPPAEPEPLTVGLPVVRLQHKHLKLTTEGAMLWGKLADRNVVELDELQMDAYLHRKRVRLRDEQLVRVTGRGFVIVRCGGTPAGVALYRPEDGPDLESLYPKAQALPEGDPAFPDPTRGGS